MSLNYIEDYYYRDVLAQTTDDTDGNRRDTDTSIELHISKENKLVKSHSTYNSIANDIDFIRSKLTTRPVRPSETLKPKSLQDLSISKKVKGKNILRTRKITKPYTRVKTEETFDEDNCQERTTIPRGTVNTNTSSMKQFHALDSLTYEFTKGHRPATLLSSGSSNQGNSYYETEHTYFAKVKSLLSESNNEEMSSEAIETENKELLAQIGIIKAELANLSGSKDNILLANTMTSRPHYASKKISAASQELEASLEEYNQLVNRLNQIRDPMYMLALSEKKGRIMQQTMKEKQSINRLRRMADIARSDLYAIDQGKKNPETLQETFDKKLEISRMNKKLETLRIKNRAFEREKEIKEEKERELIDYLQNLSSIDVFYCGGSIHTQYTSCVEKENFDFMEYSKNIDETKKKYIKAQVERDIESMLVRNKQDREHLVRLEEMVKEQRLIMQEMIETAKMGYSKEVKAILEKTDFEEEINQELLRETSVPITIEVAERHEEDEEINIAEADMKGFYTPTSAAFTDELSCEVKRLEQEYITGRSETMKKAKIEADEDLLSNSSRKMKASTELMKNRVLIRKVDYKKREVELKEKNSEKSEDNKEASLNQEEKSNDGEEILNKSSKGENEEKEISLINTGRKLNEIEHDPQMKPDSFVLEDFSLATSEVKDKAVVTETQNPLQQNLNEDKKVIEVLEVQKEGTTSEKLVEAFEQIKILQQRVDKLETAPETRIENLQGIPKEENIRNVEVLASEKVKILQKGDKDESIKVIELEEKIEKAIEEKKNEFKAEGKEQNNVGEKEEENKEEGKSEESSVRAPEDSITFSKPKIGKMSSMGRSLKAAMIHLKEEKQEKKEEEQIQPSATFTKPLISTKSIKEMIRKAENEEMKENEERCEKHTIDKPDEKKEELNKGKDEQEINTQENLNNIDDSKTEILSVKTVVVRSEQKEIENKKTEKLKIETVSVSVPENKAEIGQKQKQSGVEVKVIGKQKEIQVENIERKEVETRQIHQPSIEKTEEYENKILRAFTEEKEIQTEVFYPNTEILTEIKQNSEYPFMKNNQVEAQKVLPQEIQNENLQEENQINQGSLVQNEENLQKEKTESGKENNKEDLVHIPSENLKEEENKETQNSENEQNQEEEKEITDQENDEQKSADKRNETKQSAQDNEDSVRQGESEVSNTYTEEIIVIDAETQTDFPDLPEEEENLAITLPVPTLELKKNEVPISHEENVPGFGEISRVNRLRRGDKEIGTTNEPILEVKDEPESTLIKTQKTVQEIAQEILQKETPEKMSAQIKGTERSATLIAYRKHSERNSALSGRGRNLKVKLVNKAIEIVDVRAERKDEQNSVGISSSYCGTSEYGEASSLGDSMLIRPLKASIAVGTDDILCPGGNLMNDLEPGERKNSKYLIEGLVRKVEEKL